jgi:ATP-dependent helicase/DNAse subunit B
MIIESLEKLPEEYKNKTIYSISRLSTYDHCQYEYYLRYVLHKKGVDGIYGILGGVVHEIIEQLQKREIDNEKALQMFNDKVFEVTEILDIKFPTEQVKKNFTECVTHYITNYKPIESEKFLSEFEVFINIDGCVLVGYIDGVKFLDNNTVEIIDYKTSNKYDKNELKKYGRQLLLYAIGLSEQLKVDVQCIYWIMAKYCWITWEGATKPRQMFAPRNEIVKKLRSELKKDLTKYGLEDLEIELLLAKAEEANDLTLLPTNPQNKYIIEDGVVEYPLTDELKNELREFVKTTISEIESRSDKEDEWLHMELSNKTSFYCSMLCGQRSNCKYYKEWLESSKDTFEDKSNNDDDLMKELFG